VELAPLALLAGMLSITSPCCLPLIPGYLSYMSGVAAGGHGRARVMGAAGLFVAGFATIFTGLGATASLAGSFLRGALPLLTKISGVFVIVMGLTMLGILRIPFLYRERRMDLRKVKSGPAGAFPLGMAFAFGWTPCIGPILAGILGAAAVVRTAREGAALLAIYSLGMGIPFMAMAFAYAGRGTGITFFKRHALKIERAGGVLMVSMGILLLTGYWTRLFVPLMRLFAKSGWPPL
jgi:cytochrome c-type biogenesis protein